MPAHLWSGSPSAAARAFSAVGILAPCCTEHNDTLPEYRQLLGLRGRLSCLFLLVCLFMHPQVPSDSDSSFQH